MEDQAMCGEPFFQKGVWCRRAWEGGFTLVELLVVLVILALLAGLVAPRVIGYLGRAKTDTAGLQIENLAMALDLFYLDVGRYPTEEEGLSVLIEAPEGTSNWGGPYLGERQVPKDPWGNEYHYNQPGREDQPYDLYTFGADNREGGEGENADIWKE